MRFICYPKCSTCKKAQAFLDARGCAYEVRDITGDRPGQDELRAWQAMSGLPLKRFFNTSGLKYRALGLREKLPGMSDDDMLCLLASDGMLVRRPLLIGPDFALVGFKEAEWAKRC